MKRMKLVWFLALLVALVLPTSAALAAPALPLDGLDRIITGDNFVLADGETERGSVVIFGGSAEIEDGAVLDGDLTVFGGDVKVNGAIKGDVVVFGGDVSILADAMIDGDCVLFGGSVDVDEDAYIDGDLVTSPENEWFPWANSEERPRTPDVTVIPEIPEIPVIPEITRIPEVTTPRVVYHSRPSFAGKVGSAFLSALGVGVLALLAALFWPKQIDQVRRVTVREPVMSGLIGFLTLVAAALATPILAVISAILILICIGLLGFPIIALAWVAIGAAALFGWASLGVMVGRWVGSRLNVQGLSLMTEAALGAFTMSLVLGILDAIPLLGLASGLLQFGLVCLGLGAVVLTRFGQRDYQQGQPIFTPRPPKTPAAPVAAMPVVVETEDAPAEMEPESESEPEPEPDPEESPFEAPPLDSEGPFPTK